MEISKVAHCVERSSHKISNFKIIAEINQNVFTCSPPMLKWAITHANANEKRLIPREVTKYI